MTFYVSESLVFNLLFSIQRKKLIVINIILFLSGNKGNNKITELRTILQSESQNS